MAKKALITGGTRGIGKSLVREFARAGFDVAFTGRTLYEGDGTEEDEDGNPTPLSGSLEATTQIVRDLGREALAVQMDLLDPASVDRGIESVKQAWGSLDVLVNNAMAALWLATEDEAAQYNGQHFMAQEFARARGLWPDWQSALPMNPNWSPTAILDWREPRGRKKS